jgi:hypothetical protein
MAYAVVRHYQGSSTLMDELERLSSEVEELIRGISGFVAYYLARSEDGGGFSVSVFQDRVGAEESVRAAREFIQEKVPDAAGSPPEVIQGETFIDFAARETQPS